MRISLVTGESRKPFFDIVPDLKEEDGIFLCSYDDEDPDVEQPVATGMLYGVGAGSDFSIRYLYVEESQRHQGIATSLLFTLRIMAQPLGIGRLLVSYARDDYSAGLDGFFGQDGFTEYKRGGLSGIPLVNITEAIDDMDLDWPGGTVQYLKDLPSKTFYALSDMLNTRVKENGNDPVKTWISLKPRDVYMPQSVVAINSDGTPAGCLMLTQFSQKEVVLDYLCTFKPNQGRLIMVMLSAATAAVENTCRADTTVLCHTINSVSAGLLKKLMIRKVQPLGDVVVLEQTLG